MIKKNKVYLGDAMGLIDVLDSESVQSIITSPPYWGLRDYGEELQFGQEETFQEYIENLLCFFEKIKRVIKPTGLLFVNLADTYYGSQNGKGYKPKEGDKQAGNKGAGKTTLKYDYSALKRKTLTGIPQRFMIAMIDNGWICRNEIIWKKNNVMPSSVKDRFTVDYESIYMFSINPMYQFHQLKEPMKTKDISQPRGSTGCKTSHSGRRQLQEEQKHTNLRNMRCVWEINTEPIREAHYATFPKKLVTKMLLCSTKEGDTVLDPFMGSGTTALVAMKYKRNFIGFELSKHNIEIAKKRIRKSRGESNDARG